MVPANVFRQAVALAEKQDRMFVAPRFRDFAHAQAKSLGGALRSFLDVPIDTTSPPRFCRTTEGALREFFRDAMNRKWLTRLTKFVEESPSPGFEVVELDEE